MNCEERRFPGGNINESYTKFVYKTEQEAKSEVFEKLRQHIKVVSNKRL